MSATTFTVYKDGAQIIQAAKTPTVEAIASLGMPLFGASATGGYTGAIDHAAMWKRELSATDVANMYNCIVP
jgi:hypothetical protein